MSDPTARPESSSVNTMLAVGLGVVILLGAGASFAAYKVGYSQGTASAGEQLAAKDKQIESLRTEVAKAAKSDKKSGKEPPPPVKESTLGAGDLGSSALSALGGAQQALALRVLNAASSPCDPCEKAGFSIATCAKAKGDVCTNMSSLVDRAARLAGQGKSEEELTAALTYEAGWVPLDTTGSPADGPTSAPIVLVEFTDFQCPYCSRSQATLGALREKYGDKLQIVYKNYPISRHKLAKPAAVAAMAAGMQGKFWEYKHILFERQRELSQDGIFEQIAQEVGLNVPQWKRDLESPEIEKQIREDSQQARKVGVTGTPCFFVNGYKLKGAKPVPAFEAVIDRELADRGL
ncbi:MAG: thioredoxin domain-containing protein [Pseudomonadota bacterium]